jgi:hypothetical protein
MGILCRFANSKIDEPCEPKSDVFQPDNWLAVYLSTHAPDFPSLGPQEVLALYLDKMIQC